MPIIEQYISALFAKLPARLDILHLKDDVTADALRTYNRLCSEGMDENTAIGTVLSSLGSLADILARHGMDFPVPDSTPAADSSGVQAEALDSAVEDYLDAQYSIARMNALGTALCILGPALSIFFDEMPRFLGHWIGDGLTAVGFFGAIAVGVMLFIYAGSMQKNWRGFAHTVHLTAGMRDELYRREADYLVQRTERLALGVGLCIFSIAPAAFFDDNLGGALLFAFVAMGVYLIIVSGARAKACRKLLKNA